MNFRKQLMLALVAVAASPIYAGDEFGIWTGLGVEKDITKRFSVDAGVDFRSGSNLEYAERWSGTLGLGFKVNSFLKLGAGYTYIHDYEHQDSKVNFNNKGVENGYNVDHGHWRGKNRAFFDMTGSLKAGRFKFSLRERYVYTHSVATDVKRTRFRDKLVSGHTDNLYPWNGENFLEMTEGIDHKSGKDKHQLRSRLKVEYNIPKCPFNPFVTYEFANDLTDGLDLDRTRLVVGTEWKITKQHVVSMGYLFHQGTDGKHEGALHVIDLGYKFKF